MATATLRIAPRTFNPNAARSARSAALNAALERQRQARIASGVNAAGRRLMVPSQEVQISDDELQQRLEVATLAKRFMEDQRIDADEDGSTFAEVFDRIQHELREAAVAAKGYKLIPHVDNILAREDALSTRYTLAIVGGGESL